MTFILGIGVGVLLTIGFSLLSIPSNDEIDDTIDNNTDFR